MQDGLPLGNGLLVLLALNVEEKLKFLHVDESIVIDVHKLKQFPDESLLLVAVSIFVGIFDSGVELRDEGGEIFLVVLSTGGFYVYYCVNYKLF